jgi:hypothetical protein
MVGGAPLPHHHNLAEVAEWQTRYVQGVVSARACGFKSHLRHHLETDADGQRPVGSSRVGRS